MDDADFVDVLDACDELVEYAYGFVLVDPLVFDDVVEELPLLHVLHHQEQLLGRLDDLI